MQTVGISNKRKRIGSPETSHLSKGACGPYQQQSQPFSSTPSHESRLTSTASSTYDDGEVFWTNNPPSRSIYSVVRQELTPTDNPHKPKLSSDFGSSMSSTAHSQSPSGHRKRRRTSSSSSWFDDIVDSENEFMSDDLVAAVSELEKVPGDSIEYGGTSADDDLSVEQQSLVVRIETPIADSTVARGISDDKVDEGEIHDVVMGVASKEAESCNFSADLQNCSDGNVEDNEPPLEDQMLIEEEVACCDTEGSLVKEDEERHEEKVEPLEDPGKMEILDTDQSESKLAGENDLHDSMAVKPAVKEEDVKSESFVAVDSRVTLVVESEAVGVIERYWMRYRQRQAKHELERARGAAGTIISVLKMVVARRKFVAIKANVCTIQRCVKRWLATKRHSPASISNESCSSQQPCDMVLDSTSIEDTLKSEDHHQPPVNPASTVQSPESHQPIVPSTVQLPEPQQPTVPSETVPDAKKDAAALLILEEKRRKLEEIRELRKRLQGQLGATSTVPTSSTTTSIVESTPATGKPQQQDRHSEETSLPSARQSNVAPPDLDLGVPKFDLMVVDEVERESCKGDGNVVGTEGVMETAVKEEEPTCSGHSKESKIPADSMKMESDSSIASIESEASSISMKLEPAGAAADDVAVSRPSESHGSSATTKRPSVIRLPSISPGTKLAKGSFLPVGVGAAHLVTHGKVGSGSGHGGMVGEVKGKGSAVSGGVDEMKVEGGEAMVPVSTVGKGKGRSVDMMEVDPKTSASVAAATPAIKVEDVIAAVVTSANRPVRASRTPQKTDGKGNGSEGGGSNSGGKAAGGSVGKTRFTLKRPIEDLKLKEQTDRNTAYNSVYHCAAISVEVVRVNENRPPSPSSRAKLPNTGDVDDDEPMGEGGSRKLKWSKTLCRMTDGEREVTGSSVPECIEGFPKVPTNLVVKSRLDVGTAGKSCLKRSASQMSVDSAPVLGGASEAGVPMGMGSSTGDVGGITSNPDGTWVPPKQWLTQVTIKQFRFLDDPPSPPPVVVAPPKKGKKGKSPAASADAASGSSVSAPITPVAASRTLVQPVGPGVATSLSLVAAGAGAGGTSLLSGGARKVPVKVNAESGGVKGKAQRVKQK
ncbi:hypothetical protein HDU76_003197 [Blyttiomyces sp. JEL0837]|nr:hypothetical protein HDU76_003197 [Blyttiomyces sp. JEL0837]